MKSWVFRLIQAENFLKKEVELEEFLTPFNGSFGWFPLK